MSKIKVGIVGTGGMANGHATQYKTIPGVELASCLDVVPDRAEAFAQKHGVARVAANLDELLDQVDAVSVVTPDTAHAPISLRVLRAGKHLLCEKPLTLTLADARQVARAARQAHAKHGVMHMINFSYRASAAFQEAARLVRSGALGEIRHVHSRYLQSWLAGVVWGGWMHEPMLWRCQKAKGGGTLSDIGCHILDFTTGVAGDLAAVRCAMQTFPKRDAKGRKVTAWHGATLDANDSVVIELHFAGGTALRGGGSGGSGGSKISGGGGALGVCHTTRWATGRSNTVALEVHGTDGALSINLDEGWNTINLSLGKDCGKCVWKKRELKPTPANYQRFIRAIKTGQPEQADVVRGAQVQAYLDACERAAASGKAEKVRAWI